MRNGQKKQKSLALANNEREKGLIMTDKDKPKFNIPMSEYDRLARCFLPAIQEFFESEEGQKEYQQWLKENSKKSRDNN